jgi:hypothetical protein
MRTTAAFCAKAVRTELKKAFPTVKFSVTSENFSMGDAVRVEWTDGPTLDRVKELTWKYEYGHFDGMNDIYEISNRRDDIPQTKYLTHTRNASDQTERFLKDWVSKNFSLNHVEEWKWEMERNRFYRAEFDSLNMPERMFEA